MAIDNMIYTGFVADPSKTDMNTVTIRALNDKIKLDLTVNVCQLRLGDGILHLYERYKRNTYILLPFLECF
jgi:predicted O-methyltransferase YrrM